MTFLIFERRTHQKRQNLVEQGSWPQLPRVDGYLSQCRLAHRRGAVFYFQQQHHNLAVLLLFKRKVFVLLLVKKSAEVPKVFGLYAWHRVRSILGCTRDFVGFSVLYLLIGNYWDLKMYVLNFTLKGQVVIGRSALNRSPLKFLVLLTNCLVVGWRLNDLIIINF